MTDVGVFGVLGLAIVVLAMVLWFALTVRASRRRMRPKEVPDQQRPRGPVMGGQQRGDPGQMIPTRDEPSARRDESGPGEDEKQAKRHRD